MLRKYFMQWSASKDTSFISFFRLDNEKSRAFKYLCIFSGIYLIPLILANCYYIDDVGRFANTDFNWMKDGRPLMQIMAQFLGFGKPYLDIFPLGQLIASIILNYTLILWGRKYFGLESPSKIAGLLAISYLNLFLLESFSYVYESIGMIISLGISILLYSFPDGIPFRKTIILTIFFVIFSLSFYQASVGAYISLALLEMLYGVFQNQFQYNILRRIGTRFLGIILGMGTYFFLVAHPLVRGYGVEHSSMISLGTYQGYQQLLHHLSIYFQNIKSYFNLLI